MQFRSYLNNKSLTVLFAVCCLTSNYFNLASWQERVALRETEATATTELEVEQGALRGLQAATAGRELDARPIRKLEDELASLLHQIKGNLPAQLLTVTQLTLTKNASASKDMRIYSLGSGIVRAEGLKQMRISVAGKYESLELLEKYVAAIRTMPVILSAFTVRGDDYELEIVLIGR